MEHTMRRITKQGLKNLFERHDMAIGKLGTIKGVKFHIELENTLRMLQREYGELDFHVMNYIIEEKSVRKQDLPLNAKNAQFFLHDFKNYNGRMYLVIWLPMSKTVHHYVMKSENHGIKSNVGLPR